MTKSMLPVDVLDHCERTIHDPLLVYRAAIDLKGKANAFVLESLSGPSRDRRATIVGVDRLLTLSVFEGRAEMSGSAPLCSHLLDRLSGCGFKADPSGAIVLEEPDAVWDLLRSLRDGFEVNHLGHTSFAFFGFFSYDTIRFIEKLEPSAAIVNKHPIIALAVFQTLIYFHANGTTEVLINNSPAWERRGLGHYETVLAGRPDEPLGSATTPGGAGPRHTVTKEQYLTWVDQALHHIRSGDVYQIQLGHEVHVEANIPPLSVYRALRDNNPSPYMYLANLAGIDLIGASPELFVRMQDELIEMRPIAGTVGKRQGVPPHELILHMTRSEKERAEHIMLVDLCRNDIGRVCQPGSLDVDELMFVEEYSHLYHMVSNVRGLRRDGYDAFDVIKATFPAGTMTGAPKVRAMELIESIETTRRGIYAGAVGLIGFDDTVNTALCIRSAVHEQGTYYLRASAGIVADSDPDKEWMETLYKMGSVYRAVTGKEILG